jgi:hypothetical protein
VLVVALAGCSKLGAGEAASSLGGDPPNGMGVPGGDGGAKADGGLIPDGGRDGGDGDANPPADLGHDDGGICVETIFCCPLDLQIRIQESVAAWQKQEQCSIPDQWKTLIDKGCSIYPPKVFGGSLSLGATSPTGSFCIKGFTWSKVF